MDFTYRTYELFLKALLQQGYHFIQFSDYLANHSTGKMILLRHDVEYKYENALHFAMIQNKLGVQGTYYFRILPKSFNPEVVRQIALLGHEIGYHYDDLAQCKGNEKEALNRFKKNLKILRAIAPVQTICMDGSPLSQYDNKQMWNFYSYKEFGITGEPYFDIDFDKVFYLTDTGRRWDGWKVSLRDKVPQQEQWIKEGMVFHSTMDIIRAANEQWLPDKIMFTFHPQRWNDKMGPWVKELIGQKAKNLGKRILVKMRT